MSSVEKLREIKERCDRALTSGLGEQVWESRQEIAADILYLLQALEIRDKHISNLVNAEDMRRRLIGDFTNLTQSRRVLVLELMREMSSEATQ